MSNIHVSSEIGPLKRVILHTPGAELEQMTPENAEELLYDDILNLEAAQKQHIQLSGVLSKITETLQVKDLLTLSLEDEKARLDFINTYCRKLDACEVIDDLQNLSPPDLAEQVIVGTKTKKDTLDRFLSPKKYALPPLTNLFFTRDASMVINYRVFIGNMANNIRIAEAVLMSHIFRNHPAFLCDDFIVDASRENMPHATFEGGDLLILQEDTVLVGMSERTSAPGIDYMVEQFKIRHKIKHVFVVILPKVRATIHLDMVFTMIDVDKAVVFPPLILAKNAVDVIHINLTNPERPKFKRYPYLLDALRRVNINLEPINCGGDSERHQKREQWQSGANFFTVGPGKIIGYGMNINTYDVLAKAGLPRIEAKDVLKNNVDLKKLDKYAVAISGNELTRGGGGCRCMTMPVLRE